MCVLFKLNLLVIWLRCIQVAYGSSDQSNCVNGSLYKTPNTTEGKPSKPSVELQNKNIYVDDYVTFTCKIRANPAAEIFWLYEGHFLTGEKHQSFHTYSPCNTTLSIRYAESADTGRYSCMARNSYGETTSAWVTLAVQQKAKFQVNYKSASIDMLTSSSCDPEHVNITLKCKHNGSQGICVWKKNNNESLNEEKISYCDNMMCCLSIRDLSEEDAGLYTCFMYLDVRKVEVLVPKPDGNSTRCNTGSSDQSNSVNGSLYNTPNTTEDNQGNTGKASITKNHFAVWRFGIIALIMTVF